MIGDRIRKKGRGQRKEKMEERLNSTKRTNYKEEIRCREGGEEKKTEADKRTKRYFYIPHEYKGWDTRLITSNTQVCRIHGEAPPLMRGRHISPVIRCNLQC